MPKTRLTAQDIPVGFMSSLPEGTYSSPKYITIDSTGRISNIITGTSGFYALNAITTTSTNRIALSTSTGSVIVSQAIITATSYSLTPVNSIVIDNYGRVVSASTATVALTSSTGNFSSISLMTVDSYGKVVYINTGSQTLVIDTASANNSPVFQNLYIASTLTNFPVLEKNIISSSYAFTLNVLQGSMITNSDAITSNNGTWTISLTNVPLIGGRTLSSTVVVKGTSMSNANGNTISINGVNSSLYWLDGIGNVITGTSAVIANFTTVYNGSVFLTYGSISPY